MFNMQRQVLLRHPVVTLPGHDWKHSVVTF